MRRFELRYMRIPLIADTDSTLMADSVPRDRGQWRRVAGVTNRIVPEGAGISLAEGRSSARTGAGIGLSTRRASAGWATRPKACFRS